MAGVLRNNQLKLLLVQKPTLFSYREDRYTRQPNKQKSEPEFRTSKLVQESY